MNPDKPLRIIQLSVDNIKRLKAVRITPEGSIVVIGGDNGAGKTSLIDSIAMALGGGDEIPTLPVRKGEDSAVIVMDLGDIVIKRSFTAAGGTALTVSNKDGAKFPSPQAMIDRLTGKLTFDPFEFVRLDPKKRLTALQQLVGLDMTELNGRRASTFTARTDVNRDLQRAKNVAASLPKHEDAPAQLIDPVDLLAEIQKMAKENEAVTAAQTDLTTKQNAYRAARETHRVMMEGHSKEALGFVDRIAEAEKALAALKEQAAARGRECLKELDDSTALLKAMEESGTILAESVKKMVIQDTAPLQQRLASAQTANQKVKDNQAKEKANADVVAYQLNSDNLTAKIEKIDKEKTDLLKSAKFPIDGLSFDETGVLFEGVPFEQASSAQQLRISVAMAAALNPKLGVMLVRDGSLLDEKSLKLLAELAEAKNLQVWVERVSQGAECQVIIEDGSVKAVS